MTVKLAVLASACAAVLVATFGPSMPSASATAAKFVRCLATPLAVTAIGHGLWGTDERMTSSAIDTWQSVASQQIGTYYGNWSNALGGTVDCHRELFKVTCIATATPCRS